MADRMCAWPGCDRPLDKSGGRGYCGRCYQRYRNPFLRAGKPLPPSPRVLKQQARLVTPPGETGADEETEALTERGWVCYDDLTNADRVYALDLDGLTAGFEQVAAVTVFPRAVRSLRHTEVGGFSALTTASVRWPLRLRLMDPGYGNSGFTNITGWGFTEHLAGKQGIYRTLPNRDTPRWPTYSDAFVELVAWIWNEGSVERGNSPRITISQSWTANPHKVARIRLALDEVGPDEFRELRRDDGYGSHRLYADLSRVFLSVLGQDKAPLTSFIHALTHEQLLLFIDTCIAGDGHEEVNGVRRWSQVSMHSLRTFELICALAGVPTNTRFKPGGAGHLGRDGYHVSLLRHQVCHPLDSLAELRGGRRKGGRVEAIDEWVEHDGIVWHPVTPSGTWLARRNGSVYFTGGARTQPESATVPHAVTTNITPRVSRSARGEQLCLDLGSLIA